MDFRKLILAFLFFMQIENKVLASGAQRVEAWLRVAEEAEVVRVLQAAHRDDLLSTRELLDSIASADQAAAAHDDDEQPAATSGTGGDAPDEGVEMRSVASSRFSIMQLGKGLVVRRVIAVNALIPVHIEPDASLYDRVGELVRLHQAYEREIPDLEDTKGKMPAEVSGLRLQDQVEKLLEFYDDLRVLRLRTADADADDKDVKPSVLPTEEKAPSSGWRDTGIFASGVAVGGAFVGGVIWFLTKTDVIDKLFGKSRS